MLINKETESQLNKNVKQGIKQKFHYLTDTARSFVFLVFYASASISTVFLHRRLFVKSNGHPLIVTWVQQLITFLVFEFLFLLHTISQKCPGVVKRVGLPRQYVRLRSLRTLFLPSCSFVAMIIFSNYCIRYAPVSTYQVARSLTIVFNLVLSYFVLNESVSYHCVLACFITSFGLLIGSMDSATLNWQSCVTGILGSLFQALHATQIKIIFLEKKETQQAVLYIIAFIASIIFIPILLISGEVNHIFVMIHSNTDYMEYWTPIFISSLCGALVTFSSYLCLHVTSPINFNIASYAKAALQSLGGIMLLKETYSCASVSGIFVTIFGCAYFSFAKLFFVKKKSNTICKNKKKIV